LEISKEKRRGIIITGQGTITKKLECPASLLITTIHRKFEEQLEDRLVQIHPNSYDKRIQAIISLTAEIVSGQLLLTGE
jgi:hypothetical protein